MENIDFSTPTASDKKVENIDFSTPNSHHSIIGNRIIDMEILSSIVNMKKDLPLFYFFNASNNYVNIVNKLIVATRDVAGTTMASSSSSVDRGREYDACEELRGDAKVLWMQ